jgi:hypothetical protein
MTDAIAAGSAPAPRWPRLVLLIAAAIKLFGGLSSLPILFGDLSQVPGPGLGGAIIIAEIVLQPILALAALFFTIRGKIPYALIAMAFIILMNWLSYVPSLQLHGVNFGDGDPITGALLFAKIVLAPLLSLVVAGLALMEKHLTLATVLAVVPTILDIIGVAIFAVGVAIYGF